MDLHYYIGIDILNTIICHCDDTLSSIKILSKICKTWNNSLKINFYLLCCYKQKYLISNNWLLPCDKISSHNLKWVIENDQLLKLYEYIKTEPNICIAGGYPTLMCLNKNLADFPFE